MIGTQTCTTQFAGKQGCVEGIYIPPNTATHCVRICILPLFKFCGRSRSVDCSRMARIYTVHMNRTIYIYAIIRRSTRRAYIGSALAPIKRWAEHVSMLVHDRHFNSNLQNDWKNSSIEDWDFRILSQVPSGEDRYEHEALWIARYSAECIGHNIAKVRKIYRRDTVIEMLNARRPYREISAATGASLGAISNLKRQLDGKL